MPISSQYAWNTTLVKFAPLSVMMRFGTPNRDTILLRKLVAECLSIALTGTASGHLVNLSMAT